MELSIRLADYADSVDAEAIRELLDIYARDPMGGGRPLAPSVLSQTVARLADFPTAFSVLAFADSTPTGLVNCFESFSTFRALPLVNIHDVIVRRRFRGRGIGSRMLAFVEREAVRRGCCKLTLEVLEGNGPAQRLYENLGFDAYRLDPAAGRALFWHKELPDPRRDARSGEAVHTG